MTDDLPNFVCYSDSLVHCLLFISALRIGVLCIGAVGWSLSSVYRGACACECECCTCVFMRAIL